MILKGKLYVESPIYRGNARKTLFTRDGDGSHRLVSLAGEVSGTAQALMDAFIGESKNRKNIGLINQLWARLYGVPLPNNLITGVDCKLQKQSYPRNNFFDLRMGIKLNEDRWAAEANANYKMETVLRNSVFDFTLSLKEAVLQKNENKTRLYYVLEEMKAGRFWFGAGKSKGMGRVRLEMELPFSVSDQQAESSSGANHLNIDITFNAENPLLVGWNWGKIDPHTPSFSSIEGALMISAMKNIPESIRKRLEMALGGPILSPDDWKQKFAEHLPRIIAICLKEQSSAEVEFWVLPASGVAKLSKGKHALTKKLVNKIKPLADKPFPSPEAAEEAFKEAFGKKANMAKRVMKEIEQQRQISQKLDDATWLGIAASLGLDESLKESLSENTQDEAALTEILKPACQKILPRLYDQVDQQIKLLQSDAWVDAEIITREEHLLIKTMLAGGKIKEYQWNDPGMPPEGIRSATWREFLNSHARIQFRHMLNTQNLKKSITNDKNQIEFLKTYRDQTRQELSQPWHIDFRRGGASNREVSRKYGKPFDTIFMRMLSWSPSSREQGTWETYIPGSTIKGAFRKRASMVLRTLWGESRKTAYVLDRLFGAQRKRGMVFFSDAYLADPYEPGRSWCSMDGIRMDPKTGQPVETSKRDYLYAYGDQLTFQIRMDIQDIEESDIEMISVLFHLLRDFQNGDIPLGGEKTNGFGWTEVEISKLTWLTAKDSAGITQKLFGKHALNQKGLWQALELEGESAADALQPLQALVPEAKTGAPPKAKGGFISHRAFGGYCGTLVVEAETLTPVNIQESGEPSFTTMLEDGPVNGWDFFSMSPPEADQRSSDRLYALPSRSIRGMLRHIYTIATDSRGESADISRLNPAESLFGWVGNAPNQALMGRVSFGFGKFRELKQEPAWFKVPYPYGNWQCSGGSWKKIAGKLASKQLVANHWRLFPHAPLAPVVTRVDGFKPDTFQARYFKAILPGERACFTIRFWNLLEEELQKLLWCVALEPKLAHKMGNNRYLGFGSVRLKILDDSFLIDWNKRYSGKNNWQIPIKVDKLIDPKKIMHYKELQNALNASTL
ncbi:type III-I CRISPR-associated gRAMP effector Cas7-11i [Desulfonema magnum]|uniref:CRISPR type III-associated RAMP domain-containing protein n=1 Tax=Desulfonema magnum TaxID=45655 RepID=A0A975BP81_9BACT|nr:RAMP superfamily CRISPR-associated protein [Desulfonema magnum]QTA89146.1 CRISPR type III-associated RAMP domain-containing protein [Desulfonema magnum]